MFYNYDILDGDDDFCIFRKKITKKNFFRDVAIGQSFADGGNFIYTQLLSFIFVYTHLYNYSHFF